jgi:hypothetical protein
MFRIGLKVTEINERNISSRFIFRAAYMLQADHSGRAV